MNALRGAGDTRWPAVAVALHCWVIFIMGGYLVSRYVPSLGYHGPWMMCTAYIILLGLVLRWRFVSGAWRKIDLFGDRKENPSATTAASHSASVDAEAVISTPASVSMQLEQPDAARSGCSE